MAKSTKPRIKTQVSVNSISENQAVWYTFLVLIVDFFILFNRRTGCFEKSTFRQRKGRFSHHSHKRDQDPSAA